MAVMRHGTPSDWAALDERTRTIECNALGAACSLIPEAEAEALRARCGQIRDKADSALAWRISTTLREFENRRPMDVWFDWPLFTIDEGLKDAVEVGAEGDGYGERRSRRSKVDGRKPKMGIHGNAPIEDSSEVYGEINGAIARAVEACADDGVEPTRHNIHKRIDDVQGKKPEYRQICRWTDGGKPWVQWVPGGHAADSKRNEKVIVKRS